MAVNVRQMQRIEAHSGLMKIEETSTPRHFKVMRHGNVDSYIAHLTENECRDLFDVLGDLITFLDTDQPDS